MEAIEKVKDLLNIKNPFKDKVTNVLASNEQKQSAVVNPFLDKNGNLVNPYIDYQKALDSNTVSEKAKYFISRATGLTQSAKPKNVAASNAQVTGASYTPSSGSSIVDAAQKYIGTPYVWGGESMSEGGMDCSGFVYNALKDAGYNIGRTTAQGYRSGGTQVNKADMQPGDLVFFGNNGNATHIGIYIGNGQMIHSSGGSKNTASNPGKGVCITNVNQRNDFIEARRY